MKEKIKKIILIISICYIVLITLALTFNLIKFKSRVAFPYNETHIQKLNEYEKELSTLNKNSCTDKIKEFIDYSKKTTYEEVSFQKMYNEIVIETPISLLDAKEACNIKEEETEEYDLIFTYATYLGIFESLFDDYHFLYEIRIIDITGRLFYEADNLKFQYNMLKHTEAKIISDLIEIEKRRG